MARLNLDAFIKADPVDIVIKRSVVTQTLAGGQIKGPPTSLPSQQMRLVPFKRRVNKDVQNTQDGLLRVADYILVGRWNIDVQKGDEFSHGGLNYKVCDLEPKTLDRTGTDRVVCTLEVRD